MPPRRPLREVAPDVPPFLRPAICRCEQLEKGGELTALGTWSEKLTEENGNKPKKTGKRRDTDGRKKRRGWKELSEAETRQTAPSIAARPRPWMHEVAQSTLSHSFLGAAGQQGLHGRKDFQVHGVHLTRAHRPLHTARRWGSEHTGLGARCQPRRVEKGRREKESLHLESERVRHCL